MEEITCHGWHQQADWDWMILKHEAPKRYITLALSEVKGCRVRSVTASSIGALESCVCETRVKIQLLIYDKCKIDRNKVASVPCEQDCKLQMIGCPPALRLGLSRGKASLAPLANTCLQVAINRISCRLTGSPAGRKLLWILML